MRGAPSFRKRAGTGKGPQKKPCEQGLFLNGAKEEA